MLRHSTVRPSEIIAMRNASIALALAMFGLTGCASATTDTEDPTATSSEALDDATENEAEPIDDAPAADEGTAAAEPIQAFGGCTAGTLCSQIANHSPWGVDTIKDWCRSETLYAPPHNADPCPKSAKKYLAPGAATPNFQDWDAFRAPRNCVTKYYLIPYWGERKIDRRGKGDAWYHVHNGETGWITAIDCQ
jgi:hypothetical protein